MQDREGAVVRLDRLASDDRHLALLQGGTQVRRGHGQMEERDESLPLEVLVLGGRRAPSPDSPLALRGPVRGRVLPLAYPNQAGARYPPSAPAGTLKGGIFMRRRVEVFIGPFGGGKADVAPHP